MKISFAFATFVAVSPSFGFTQPVARNAAATCESQRKSVSDTQLRSSKGPLDQLKNFIDSASASVTDYLTMQPKRETPAEFRRVQTQFIAALGDPEASSGTGAENWGLWRVDPGPRGVYLADYGPLLESRGGRAPAGWTFDKKEWWLEEYGRIMEPPDFPMPAGRYLVTGGREVTTVLTVDPPDKDGQQQWALDGNAKLFDVTHLPCRSARYWPKKNQDGSPATAQLSDFPVTPGAEMPIVEGCEKQDYAVLFIIGLEKDK